MSNTSKGRAEKGSKFWMQMIPNMDFLKKEFDEIIGDELEWLSPLKGEENLYEEYELRTNKIKEALGIEGNNKEIFYFWPNVQPKWDGIALGKGNNILYLVEAKAHIKEMKYEKSGASKESKEKIKEKMRKVFWEKYSMDNIDKWIDSYYQLGNRIFFMHKMNEIIVNNKEIDKVKLVLINFTDDFTNEQDNVGDWKKEYKKVFKLMTGSSETPEGVINIFYSVQLKGIQ